MASHFSHPRILFSYARHDSLIQNSAILERLGMGSASKSRHFLRLVVPICLGFWEFEVRSQAVSVQKGCARLYLVGHGAAVGWSRCLESHLRNVRTVVWDEA